MLQGKRKIRTGIVISDKMDKTISIESKRLVKHPKFGKFLKKSTIYKAHDQENQAKTGDEVEIIQTRPLSKTKHWRLRRIVKKGGEIVKYDNDKNQTDRG